MACLRRWCPLSLLGALSNVNGTDVGTCIAYQRVILDHCRPQESHRRFHRLGIFGAWWMRLARFARTFEHCPLRQRKQHIFYNRFHSVPTAKPC